jgi:hypothetical protein
MGRNGGKILLTQFPKPWWTCEDDFTNRRAEKQSEKRSSTQFGIQMEDSDEHSENTPDSIRQSFDGVSKMTERRDRQSRKQFEQRISTQFGIQMEDSDEH